MLNTKTNESAHCPACKTKLSAASGPYGLQQPRPGDLSLCLKCLAWLRFNQDMTMRLLTLSEIELLDDGTKQLLNKLGRICHEVKKKVEPEQSPCH